MSDHTRRIKLAFTRSGTFVQTGGIAVDVPFPYNPTQIKMAVESGEFAEFLPTSMQLSDDDFQFEEIG